MVRWHGCWFGVAHLRRWGFAVPEMAETSGKHVNMRSNVDVKNGRPRVQADVEMYNSVFKKVIK
jgi:hypothetical protein